MNYDRAAELCKEHAPDVYLDPDKGLAHVDLRKEKGHGICHSIMLPMSTPANPLDPEQEDESFIASLAAAKRHLG